MRHIPRRYNRTIQLYTLGTLAASLLLTLVALLAMYNPPRMLADQDLPALHGGPVDFDSTLRFLGYAQNSSIIRQGENHSLTLCWQVLRETTRTGAYLLKIFDEDSVGVGERQTVPGLGHYDSSQWRAGDRFCDTFAIPVHGPLEQAKLYDMVLSVADDRTLQQSWVATTPDGKPITTVIIGSLISPAGDISHLVNTTKWHSVDVTFPGFADLAGTSIEGQPVPGGRVSLDLLWNVTGRTPDNWFQFIHLAGQGQEYDLADGLPRGGKYPTWAWSPGETIVDRWQFNLPAQLAPGNYTIKIGFYRQDTGERMPVMQDLKAISDQSPSILSLIIR